MDDRPLVHPRLAKFLIICYFQPTEYGAAVLSAYAQGEFSALSDIKHCVDIKYRFEPAMSQDQRETTVELWHRAVERSLDWIHTK